MDKIKEYNFRVEVEEQIDYDAGGNKIGDLEYRLYKMPENKLVTFAYAGSFVKILESMTSIVFED